MKVLLNLQYGYYFLDLTLEHVKTLQSKFPQILFVNLGKEKDGKEKDTLISEIEDADVLATWPVEIGRFKRMGEKAKKLKWVQFSYAGVSQEYLKIAQDNNWISTNAKGIASESVSLHVLSLIFAFERNLNLAFQLQQEKKWDHRYFTKQPLGFEGLKEKILGIVGLGSIGKNLAGKASALGMRVWGIKKDINESIPSVEKILPPSQLSALLKESDILVLCAPLLEETSCLLGEPEFNQMKRTAYLINVARGGLIDEKALMNALQKGKIAGAALDVAQKEPLAPESLLYQTPNLILTPHIAGLDRHYTDSLVDLITENLKLFLENKSLKNQMDYSKGY